MPDNIPSTAVRQPIRGLSRLFLRKSVEQMHAEHIQQELKRSLNSLNLISLGIGCIIGTGIFVLTGRVAADSAGPAIMISFHHNRRAVYICRPVLFGTRFDAAGIRIGLFLFLCLDGRSGGVGHGFATGAGVRARRLNRGGRLVELCGQSPA